VTIDNPAAYWNPLWESGRRYRRLTAEETTLISQFVGQGYSRPALDLGCGDGTLARHLHHELSYRTTGIDCSTAAVKIATAESTCDC
jgi:methylase of polypeptide subunit release factors